MFAQIAIASQASDWILALVLGIPLFCIGAVPIIGLAVILRRYFKTLSSAWRLAISHASIVLLCVALYPTDIFCPPGMYDDIYFSLMFVPGLHIYFPAARLAGAFWPKLQTIMSFHAASILCIVFIPGIICLFVGSFQWYLIGRFYQRHHDA